MEGREDDDLEEDREDDVEEEDRVLQIHEVLVLHHFLELSVVPASH